MKLALLTWKRYQYKFDTCDKDEVDIDSQDFDITELHDLDEDNAKTKKASNNQMNSTLKANLVVG